MTSRLCYLNGAWVPESQMRVSAYDLSVMQGAAAFEMTRSFHRVHFKLLEHLTRLRQSCGLLHIPLPADFDSLPEICAEITERNQPAFCDDDEHRLLIVVSPGCAPMYRGFAGAIEGPWLYVTDFPLRHTVKGMGRYFAEGVHCVTSLIQQVPDSAIPSQAKHRSRLHFHLAQQQAPAGTWPLMLDEDGHYCEAPGANIVQVEDNNVFVWERNSLPGISMQTVKELTDAHRAYGGYGFKDATELWLTGTPFCMLPVVSVDGKPIGDGTPGPVYKKILAAWSESVGVDIAGQIQRWDASDDLTQALLRQRMLEQEQIIRDAHES